MVNLLSCQQWRCGQIDNDQSRNLSNAKSLFACTQCNVDLDDADRAMRVLVCSRALFNSLKIVQIVRNANWVFAPSRMISEFWFLRLPQDIFVALNFSLDRVDHCAHRTSGNFISLCKMQFVDGELFALNFSFLCVSNRRWVSFRLSSDSLKSFSLNGTMHLAVH